MNVIREYFWIFRSKEDGHVDLSRHERPDFCAGLTESEIRQNYDRMLVVFPFGKFDYEAISNKRDEQ